MTQINRHALVHYTPAQMYQLVNDIDCYSQFLPWCRNAKVLTQNETEMTASIEIAKGILNKTFTTHNILYKNERIELALVDGPFKKLVGSWQFEALQGGEACKVLLSLNFEFKSSMMSLTAKPIFTQIANSLVDSFCKRAKDVYTRAAQQ